MIHKNNMHYRWRICWTLVNIIMSASPKGWTWNYSW